MKTAFEIEVISSVYFQINRDTLKNFKDFFLNPDSFVVAVEILPVRPPSISKSPPSSNIYFDYRATPPKLLKSLTRSEGVGPPIPQNPYTRVNGRGGEEPHGSSPPRPSYGGDQLILVEEPGEPSPHFQYGNVTVPS